MQQSPLERTLRYVIFSIGFVLFITMAFRAAHQATDPRFIKGQPFLLGTPSASAQATGVNSSLSDAVRLASAVIAQPASSPRTDTSSSDISTDIASSQTTSGNSKEAKHSHTEWQRPEHSPVHSKD